MTHKYGFLHPTTYIISFYVIKMYIRWILNIKIGRNVICVSCTQYTYGQGIQKIVFTLQRTKNILLSTSWNVEQLRSDEIQIQHRACERTHEQIQVLTAH